MSERFRAMPLRREFWRTYPNLLKGGALVLPEDEAEREDARNAAQAIMIGYIERELMETFRRPMLPGQEEFYTEFQKTYVPAITEQEFAVWNRLGAEVMQQTEKAPAADLDDKSAAYLTLTFFGYEAPPQSMELYMYIPVVARAYESLLRDKYGDSFSNELLHEKLRKHLKPFLLKFISMDAITSMLIALNVITKETRKQGILMHSDAILDPRFMDLGNDDSLSFTPKLIEAIHKHVQEKGIVKDNMGRTEDRGCPVLYSRERDAVVDFAVNELIVQHKQYTEKAKSHNPDA